MSIAIIPARGGSTRIPRKNVKMFHGQPIIAYSIKTALDSGLFSRVVVSSEDLEIQQIAIKYGAGIQPRPAELAQDEVGTQEVMKQALIAARNSGLTSRYACCIYPTAPMMTTHDLVLGYQSMIRRLSCYAFSVGTDPLQDAGQWYWGKVDAFLEDVPLIDERSIMVPIDRRRVCDINTPEDWERAELRFITLRVGI